MTSPSPDVPATDGQSFGPIVIGLAVQAITAYTAWLSEREIRIDSQLMWDFLKEAGLVAE